MLLPFEGIHHLNQVSQVITEGSGQVGMLQTILKHLSNAYLENLEG